MRYPGWPVFHHSPLYGAVIADLFAVNLGSRFVGFFGFLLYVLFVAFCGRQYAEIMGDMTWSVWVGLADATGMGMLQWSLLAL